jgi:hypothetical protein
MINIKCLKGRFATDTLWATTKSLNSNVATQIYTHKCGFNATHHLTRANEEQVGYSLSDFVHEYGAWSISPLTEPPSKSVLARASKRTYDGPK